jgi:hypothetical protein
LSRKASISLSSALVRPKSAKFLVMPKPFVKAICALHELPLSLGVFKLIPPRADRSAVGTEGGAASFSTLGALKRHRHNAVMFQQSLLLCNRRLSGKGDPRTIAFERLP